MKAKDIFELLAAAPEFPCSVGCGACCRGYKPSDWRPGMEPFLPNGDCSRLGPEGCTLPREERPTICNTYLCLEMTSTTKDWEQRITAWLDRYEAPVELRPFLFQALRGHPRGERS